MKERFIDFWRLYKPVKKYVNRYLACQRRWQDMDERSCTRIIRELTNEQAKDSSQVCHAKNPYFYLIDWVPPQPHWLSPKEVGTLLAQHVPLAVCMNEETRLYGTVTKNDAEEFELKVHHYM